MKTGVSTVVLFVLWVAMTGSFDPQELSVGLLVAAGVSLIAPGVAGPEPVKWLHPKRYLYAVVYMFYFIYAMVKANLDVALRVINPKLPINPGIVKVKTRLKTNAGKLALANSITLTPGTLSVDVVGQYLYIHWIDVKSPDIETATQEIVKGFEKFLEVIFE